MSFESRDYLRHILVEADYLVEGSAGLSYDAFAADETLRRAFVSSRAICTDILNFPARVLVIQVARGTHGQPP
jgi:hypothetical protein